MNKWKLRNTYGKLINRCNRCGQKLPHFDLLDQEPLCDTCINKLRNKEYQASGINKDIIKRNNLIKHRNSMYEDAINRLIDGKETPEYVKYRWKKLKKVR